MTLQLMKVERGLSEGEVLYHSYVTKTQEEVCVGRVEGVCVNIYGVIQRGRLTLRSALLRSPHRLGHNDLLH